MTIPGKVVDMLPGGAKIRSFENYESGVPGKARVAYRDGASGAERLGGSRDPFAARRQMVHIGDGVDDPVRVCGAFPCSHAPKDRVDSI